MAKKNKEQVNANNLRSTNFAEFEATHQFTKDSKKADFTRAAIKAGLTTPEIIEIGDAIYGEGEMKATCVNWYRTSDPVLTGKERYKPTGARALEVRNKVIEYVNALSDEDKDAFVDNLVEAVGIEGIINTVKPEVLKTVVPADLFPAKVKPVKRELTEVEKLLKKQEAAEKKAAKLKEELAALQAAEVAQAE